MYIYIEQKWNQVSILNCQFMFVVGIANIMLIIFKLQNITLNKHLPWDALGNN